MTRRSEKYALKFPIWFSVKRFHEITEAPFSIWTNEYIKLYLFVVKNWQRISGESKGGESPPRKTYTPEFFFTPVKPPGPNPRSVKLQKSQKVNKKLSTPPP